MSRKRDSFLSLPTKKWKRRLGLGVDEDEIQTKVLKATPDNHANIDLADFSQVVQLTSAGPEKTQKALQAILGVILCNEWKVAFKGLQLLDYLLHYGSEEVLPWVNKHIASLQTLVWDIYDQEHKGVLLGYLKVIRSLVEDGERLQNERSDPLQRWLDRATRSPPLPALPTINAAIAPPRSTQNLARREISPSNVHNQIAPKEPSSNNQDCPSPDILKTLFTMKEELHQNQGDAGGVLAEANVPPTKKNDGSTNAQMKDDLVPILNRGNHPEDPHRNIVRILTLQAIHMLLACQSIMEFLRLNGKKMKFSRERDTQLWNSYLSRISADGVQDLDFYRNRLIGYSQDLENIPSEHINRLGGPILKRSIKEMQNLSFSLENFVKFGERYIFTDDASRPAFYRLFIEPGRGAFEYVAQWEEEITEIAARNGDSIMSAMNQIESEDLIFRRQHLIFAYQMREIATQFIEFAKESGPRSQLKPLGLDSLKVIEPSHGLSFLTPSQDSEYKSMFVAITGEGSQLISKEKATEAIKTTDIHPQSVAHIWEAVADVTSSDELYFPEFALAMYLGNELCEGRSIKLKLPPKMKQEIAYNVRLIKTNIALDIANTWATKYRQKMEMTQEQSESLIPASESVSTKPPTTSISSNQTSYKELHKVLLPNMGDSTETVSRSPGEAGEDTSVKTKEKTEAMFKTMKHNIASRITKTWAERYLQQADIAQEHSSGGLSFLPLTLHQ